MDRINCAVRALTRLTFAAALIIAAGCNRAPQAPTITAAAPPPAHQTLPPAPPPRQLPLAPCTAMSEIVACSANDTEGPSLSLPSSAALPSPVAEGSASAKQNSPSAANSRQAAGKPLIFAISPEDAVRQQPPVRQQPTMVSAAPYTSAPPSFACQPTLAAPAAPPMIDEPPEASAILPWGPSKPTTEMAAVAQRAEQAARRGFNLAERGALYSARSQFIECLKIVSQALDEQLHTTAHSKALSAGLRAIEEVDDFVPRDSRLQTDLNVGMIAAGHRTPILKSRAIEKLTAADVQRLYLTYAQEQLAAASGDQSVGSLALHGLGKICTTPADMHGPREQIAEAKAVAYYQAALLVEPRNFMAANELGVILARYGRLKQAQGVLEQAVARSSAAPAACRNLAVVYERLGEPDRAAAARKEGELSIARLQQSGHAAAGMRYPIEWVDADVFANNNSMVASSTSSVMTSPQQPATAQATPAATATPATAAKPKGFWPWTR